MKTKLVGLVVAVLGVLVLGSFFISDVAMIPDDEDLAFGIASSGFAAELNGFRRDIGRYPTQEEGLSVLLAPNEAVQEHWDGPYLERIPTDPWGNEYVYRTDESEKGAYRIVSLGPDGIESEDDIFGKTR
ncbi:MAG: type II secretion system protein GspG [Opitutaceae bacterium]